MRDFHGARRRRGYFEGWYFKQQNQAETLAFIPALHIDKQGHRSASIQIVHRDGTACAEFGGRDFSAQNRRLFVKVGPNRFSAEGLSVDIHTPEISVEGQLRFGERIRPRYDIMGPFAYVPFLQCRHSVWSFSHSIRGSLLLNGRPIGFPNGTGYIDGDRGRSFPRRYLWTQCNAETAGRPCSLMLSVADIPLFPFSFTGIIGFVYWGGREYRIATYLGAKAAEIGKNSLVVRQGHYLLECTILKKTATLLRAPLQGAMRRRIREDPACRARYRFWENGGLLFDFTSEKAGFEWEYGKPLAHRGQDAR